MRRVWNNRPHPRLSSFEQPEQVRQGVLEGRVVPRRFERGGDAARRVDLGGEHRAGKRAVAGRSRSRRGLRGSRDETRRSLKVEPLSFAAAPARVVRVDAAELGNGELGDGLGHDRDGDRAGGPLNVARSSPADRVGLALGPPLELAGQPGGQPEGQAGRESRPAPGRRAPRPRSRPSRSGRASAAWPGGSKNCAISSRQRVRPNQAVSRL